MFKTLFDKGLVYRGFKVMPYSMACATPISNFEKDLNYQDVNDPAVVVTFPLTDEPETSFVAWTTTPWTLPSNLALCVHPDLIYIKIKEKVRDLRPTATALWTSFRQRLTDRPFRLLLGRHFDATLAAF